MGIGPELLGGIAGSAAGAAASSIGGGGGNSNKLLDQYNSLLQGALHNALNYSQNYTGQAVGQENQSLGTATGALNSGYNTALQQLLSGTNSGFQIGQALLTPYRNAGYNANDAYSQSLGLSTPIGGSMAQANQATGQAQAQQYANQIFGPGGIPTGSSILSNPTAPANINITPDQISQDQIAQYVKNNYTSKNIYTGVGNQIERTGTIPTLLSNQGVTSQIAALLAQQQTQQQNAAAQQQYQQQQQAYQQQQQQLTQYNNQLSQLGLTATSPGAAAMTPDSTSGTAPGNTQSTNPLLPAGQTTAAQSQQAGLSNFLNSPEYQALFGSQAGQQYSQTGQYDPVAAFKANPATQFAIDQGMKSINQQAASQGLLGSGQLQQSLLNYATGLVNQNYNTYQNQLANTFSGYQNNLAQLTNMGSGLTGANTAAQLYSNLGNNSANLTSTNSQNIANANLGVGANIASLYANQGSLGASAYLNTGAAQANGLLNIAGMNAQAINQQAVSNAGAYNANQANQGAVQAANALGGYGNTQNYGNGTSTYTGNPWGIFGRTAGTY